MCRNVEKLIEILLEELRIMDRNTMDYMIDQMQEGLDETRRKLDETQK